MLQMILPEGSSSLLAFFGILFAFGATVLATAKLSPYLPKDAGREFAHDGKLSAGKPRGAGIIFVLAFVASVLLFSLLSAELVIYLLLIVVCMMTGFLDDASKTPWGEYKKGFLDLCVAALVAISFALSFVCNYLPGISSLSEGTRTILLTVIISGAAAILFPVKQDAEEAVPAENGESVQKGDHVNE